MSPPRTGTCPAAGSRMRGVSHRPEDAQVRLGHGRSAAGRDLGVRLVDESDVRHGEDRTHDRLAHQVHRGVVVVVRIALPRGGVQDRAPCAGRDERSPAQVELWPTDAHQPARVELQQPGHVALDGGLPRHEHPVVGLGVVARHGLLVALAVVDVDVQPTAVEQGLEVLRRVVAVEHHLGVQRGVELGELREGRGREHRQVRPRLDHRRRRRITQDDADGVDVVQDVEDLQPLDQLVGPAGVTREVRGDGNRVHDESLVRRVFPCG